MWVSHTLPLVLLTPILLYAAYCDLRWLRIPNWLSLATLALFCVMALTLYVDEILARLIVAGIVFSIGLILFALRLLGAGDVKLLSALLLFVPTGHLLYFGQIFSVTLLLGTTLIVIGRRIEFLGHMGWKSIDTPGVFPMGISISSTGLLVLLPILLG